MKQNLKADERIDILLVDDRLENLLAMQAALEGLGHNLVSARSGREALEHVLQNSDFAAIVLDIQMPEMDGFETAALVRQREKSRHIPIIFLTAYGTSEAEVFRGYSVGAVDYLIKPVVPEILRAKVAVFVDLFKTRKQVERMNEILEQRVRERTEELQRSEEKFRGIFENIQDVFYRTDMEGIIQMISPSITRYGYNIKELIGKEFKQVCAEPMTIDHLMTLLSEKRTLEDLELILRRKDGTTAVISTTARLLSDSEGRPCGMEGILHDITERKLAHETLERMVKELKEKNKETEDFIYIVSHDLKTPLISIQGFFGELYRGVRKRVTENEEFCFSRIKANLDQLQTLIHDLLELSRVSRVNTGLEEVDLAEVLEGVVKRLEYQIKEKQIDIRIQNGLPRVTANTERVNQMFTNLIANAIDYMGDQTDPVVEIGFHEEETGDRVLFHIKDNGIGIPKEYQGKIFEIFERLPEAKDLQPNGTGVGLAIVKKIIDSLGGRIWVDSEVGKGTTFYFTLARATTRVAAQG